jgi:putative ABC transport system ATP-binding protein
MPALVRLDHVTKDYTEGRELRHVLKDASLEVGEGEFVAIRGRSGSGKSTVLNLVAGIDQPSSGEIYLAGKALSRLGAHERTCCRRDHIGFVFQFFNLIPTLRVPRTCCCRRALRPGRSAPRRGAARRVGLADRASSLPTTSRARASSAWPSRALVCDPPLVLADEPTGNLDDATGATVMGLLDALTRRAGKTLLLATHSREVAALADRVLTIEGGRPV